LCVQIGDVVQPSRRRTRASSNGLLVQLELNVSIYNAAEDRSCWIAYFGGCVSGFLTEICIRYDGVEVDENIIMLLGVDEKESELPRRAGRCGPSRCRVYVNPANQHAGSERHPTCSEHGEAVRRA
jgi:hypothetical protein